MHVPLPKMTLIAGSEGYLSALVADYPDYKELVVSKSLALTTTDSVFRPVVDEVRGTCGVLEKFDAVEDPGMVFGTNHFFTYRLYCECPGGGEHYCRVDEQQVSKMFQIPEKAKERRRLK